MIGLVVHPRREIDRALAEIREWAEAHGADVVQVAVPGQGRHVADIVDAGQPDLIVAVGGDGTTLAALHAAASTHRPVLGAACGSLGVLTSVPAGEIATALDRFFAGDWIPDTIPALAVEGEARGPHMAINDLVVLRGGGGQVVTSVTVDGELYARLAGDGLIVSTPLGTSAYTIAAHGPLVARDACAYVMTPLAPHGARCPAYVVGDASRIQLEVYGGYFGVRFEVDGQETDLEEGTLTVEMRRDHAVRVTFSDSEPLVAGLRRHGLVADSPRVRVRDARTALLR